MIRRPFLPLNPRNPPHLLHCDLVSDHAPAKPCPSHDAVSHNQSTHHQQRCVITSPETDQPFEDHHSDRHYGTKTPVLVAFIKTMTCPNVKQSMRTPGESALQPRRKLSAAGLAGGTVNHRSESGRPGAFNHSRHIGTATLAKDRFEFLKSGLDRSGGARTRIDGGWQCCHILSAIQALDLISYFELAPRSVRHPHGGRSWSEDIAEGGLLATCTEDPRCSAQCSHSPSPCQGALVHMWRSRG